MGKIWKNCAVNVSPTSTVWKWLIISQFALVEDLHGFYVKNLLTGRKPGKGVSWRSCRTWPTRSAAHNLNFFVHLKSTRRHQETNQCSFQRYVFYNKRSQPQLHVTFDSVSDLLVDCVVGVTPASSRAALQEKCLTFTHSARAGCPWVPGWSWING